jgi:hypothetical protein
MPASSSADIPDGPETKLVIFGPNHPHIARSDNGAALTVAAKILARLGNAPRDYRNCLVPLVVAGRGKVDQSSHGFAAWVFSEAFDGSDLGLG